MPGGNGALYSNKGDLGTSVRMWLPAHHILFFFLLEEPGIQSGGHSYTNLELKPVDDLHRFSHIF